MAKEAEDWFDADLPMPNRLDGECLRNDLGRDLLTLFDEGFQILNRALEGFVNMRTFGSVIDLVCLLYTSPSPRDRQKSRMPSSA